MAICWTAPVSTLDQEFVFSPERYSARRSAGLIAVEKTVPLSDIAELTKATINPPHPSTANQKFIVLDTTHAVEGRIHFTGEPINGGEVGSVKRPIQAGNVIVSRLRTYLRQVALIDDELVERFGVPLACSTEFYVLQGTDDHDIAFLIPFLLSEPVQEVFRNAQEGGHHPRIHHTVLTELRVPAALLMARDEVSGQVRQYIKQVRNGEDVFRECTKRVALFRF
jgi:hypothetical protein